MNRAWSLLRLSREAADCVWTYSASTFLLSMVVTIWSLLLTSVLLAVSLRVLVRTYFGYPWKVIAESRQGYVAFQIPDLMGPTLHYFIRLAEYSELTPELIVRCGGELLERMGLPRTKLDMALYVDAQRRRESFQFGDVKGASK